LFSSKSRDFGALFSQNPLYECHWNYSLSHQVVRRIVFLEQKMGEFWIFVPNVNLTNCFKIFLITKFIKEKKIPLSQT